MNTVQKVIVLDLKGTLTIVSHEKFHFSAFALACNVALGLKNITPLWILDNIQGAVGGGDEHIAQGIVRHFGCDEACVHTLMKTKAEFYCALTARTPIEARPGSHQAIKWFKEQGYSVAICSNTPRTHAVGIVNAIGISDLIPSRNMVFAGGNIRKKPAPDGLIEVARRLKVSPKDLVLFGDSEYDGMAANAAGAQWVAVPTFHDVPIIMQGLREQNPVDIITDWEKVDFAALMAKVHNRAQRTHS